MGRRRRTTGSDLHGFVAVDKPAGITTFQVASRARRALDARRTGHAGTLDPFATGLVIVLVGSASRLMQWVVGARKRYLVDVTLGEQSSSDDVDGVVEPVDPVRASSLTREQVAAALTVVASRAEQVPPQVSALHVEGERAHARVRRGERLELAPRPVTFHRWELLSWDAPTRTARIDATVSSGTYLRALARDLGEQLAVGGLASALRRTEVGDLRVEDAVALDRLGPSDLRDPLELVAHLRSIQLGGEQLVRFCQGQQLPTTVGEFPLVVTDTDGHLVGIARRGRDQDTMRAQTVVRSGVPEVVR